MTRPIFSWRHAILRSDLPPTTRHVLLTLSCHMNDAGESCFPSIATLVEETGLSNRSVIDHIRSAKEAGWLKVGLHGFGGQKWRSHEYACATPEAGEAPSPGTEKGGEPASPAQQKGGEPPSKKVVKEVHSISTRDNTTKDNQEIEQATSSPAQCFDKAVQPIQKKRDPSAGTRLPPDWVLSQALGEWALAEGLTRERIRQEADKFRDYWISKPGAAGRKADWPATWRNWIRKATTGETGGGGVRSVRGNSLADSLTDTSWAR